MVTFGTPVTLGLYHALQDAQIASGKLASSCKGTPGTNNPRDAQGYSVSEACMPSLSKAQIASIFSGNAVDWSEFGLTNPAGDNAIYVARRVVTSGTQTGARVFFLNDPCAASVVKFVNGNDGQSATAADACNAAAPAGTVFEGSGSGNVEACVTNHERNHRWAISINSLEFPAASNDTTPEYAVGGRRRHRQQHRQQGLPAPHQDRRHGAEHVQRCGEPLRQLGRGDDELLQRRGPVRRCRRPEDRHGGRLQRPHRADSS